MNHSTTPPLVQVDGLRTTFRTMRGLVRAVDGVDLTLQAGERLGIVGESGSGKSVLVRSLMGLFADDPNAELEGTVTFEGQDLKDLDRQQRRHFWGREIAMVFQDPMTSLNPVKRIGQQITDPMRYHLDLKRAEARRRATDLLERLRIPEAARRMDQYPHELSGGMRQRIALAVALSCEPKVLIADEPTTALDVTVQKQILDLIDQLAADMGTAVVLITHDLGVAAGRTDRIAVMYAGRIVEQATPIELFDHLGHPYTHALLRSSPRLDRPSHERLHAIGGRPPDMANPPTGCRFADRCELAGEVCRRSSPVLVERRPGHLVACHLPLNGGSGEGEGGATAAEAPTASPVDDEVLA